MIEYSTNKENLISKLEYPDGYTKLSKFGNLKWKPCGNEGSDKVKPMKKTS